MKKLKILAIVMLLLGLPLFTFAYSAADDNFYLAEDEVLDGNLIKTVGTATIDGAVNGDVIVLGGTITISGPVAGDVFVIGGNIKVKGDVMGSVRVAGGDVVISGYVERNVNAAGGTLELSDSAEVGWDLIAAGGNVVVNGKVNGNINIAGGNIIFTNEVGKDLDINLGADGYATLRSGTKVGGDFNYLAATLDQVDINENVEVAGETKHKTVTSARVKAAPAFGAIYFFGKLVSLFGMFIVGLVLISLAPKVVTQVSVQMTKAPGRSLGWGLIYLILTPIVILLLIITIIGIPLGMILIPMYFIAIYLSGIFVGVTVGLLLVNWLTKGKYKKTMIWPMILGLVICDIVFSIPIIGWILAILAVMWAMGALLEVKKSILSELR
ncbi:FapA family protein [Patescibacteria group bacterium]|nr:FapA family protein [Patescibacteria group bacterium]